MILSSNGIFSKGYLVNRLLKEVMKLMSVSKKCQKKTSRAFFLEYRQSVVKGLTLCNYSVLVSFISVVNILFLHNFSGYSLKGSDAISCLTFFTFLLYNRKGGELNFSLKSFQLSFYS